MSTGATTLDLLTDVRCVLAPLNSLARRDQDHPAVPRIPGTHMNRPTRDFELLAVSKGAVPYRGKTYRLLGADGGSYYSFNKGLFGGNGRGNYGQLDCPSALRAIERGQT